MMACWANKQDIVQVMDGRIQYRAQQISIFNRYWNHTRRVVDSSEIWSLKLSPLGKIILHWAFDFGGTLRTDVQKLEQGWIKVGAKNTAGWSLLVEFCTNYVMVLKCKIVNFMEYNVQSTTSGGLLQDIALAEDDKLHVGNHVLADVVGIICTHRSNTSGELSRRNCR